MKKVLCILLSALLVLGAVAAFAACGNKTNTDNTTAPAAPDDNTATASYVFLEEKMGVESYAIGFRKGDTELAAQVTAAYKALVKNGTYDEIGKKYPDIYDYLNLKAEDISDDEIAEQGSGDSSYVFKHGFDLDFPPYSYRQDDGTVGGFDVEMAQALCEYLGWGYEAVPFNWDAKDAELTAGSCDCIWSGFTLEGREDDYTWGIVYSENEQGILVAADSGIKTLADLAGKTVGVQTSTSAYDMLQDAESDAGKLAATFSDLKVYETYTIAYNDLKAGAIDAIAIDMTAGAFLIANDNG